MTSALKITTLFAGIGFLLNMTIFYLVLSRGRKLYHFLFAGMLMICALWDLGILIAMLRNEFDQELILIGLMTTIPCVFLLPLIFHFTCSYLERPRVKTSLLLWIVAAEAALLMSAGKFGRITGIQAFSWGNFWRGDENWYRVTQIGMLIYLMLILVSCGMLLARLRQAGSHQERRQVSYILVGFLALGLATIRAAPVLGVDLPYLIPAGLLVNDFFVVLIGITIVRHPSPQPGARTRSIFLG